MVAGVDGADYTVRELLIEMRGEMKLIRKDNETQFRDMTLLRERTHELAQILQVNYSETTARLNKIEQAAIADRNFNKGKELGFDKAVKAVYALAGICGLGGIAAAIKILLPAFGGH